MGVTVLLKRWRLYYFLFRENMRRSQNHHVRSV